MFIFEGSNAAKFAEDALGEVAKGQAILDGLNLESVQAEAEASYQALKVLEEVNERFRLSTVELIEAMAGEGAKDAMVLITAKMAQIKAESVNAASLAAESTKKARYKHHF